MLCMEDVESAIYWKSRKTLFSVQLRASRRHFLSKQSQTQIQDACQYKEKVLNAVIFYNKRRKQDFMERLRC